MFDFVYEKLEQLAGGVGTDGSNLFEPQIVGREQSPGFDELNSEIEQARLQSIALERSRTAIREKIAKKEKKKEKKKKKRNLTDSDCEDYMMASVDQVDPTNGASSESLPEEMRLTQRQLDEDANSIAAEDERKKHREPPIVFKDIEVCLFIFGIACNCKKILENCFDSKWNLFHCSRQLS